MWHRACRYRNISSYTVVAGWGERHIKATWAVWGLPVPRLLLVRRRPPHPAAPWPQSSFRCSARARARHSCDRRRALPGLVRDLCTTS